MDANGSNQRRLTDNDNAEGEPKWSPDGSEIVFMSDRDGDLDIYVMDAGGGNVRRLTNSEGSDRKPRWRPAPTASDG